MSYTLTVSTSKNMRNQHQGETMRGGLPGGLASLLALLAAACQPTGTPAPAGDDTSPRIVVMAHEGTP